MRSTNEGRQAVFCRLCHEPASVPENDRFGLCDQCAEDVEAALLELAVTSTNPAAVDLMIGFALARKGVPA